MMKTAKLIGLFFIFLIGIACAGAISVPIPISGKIDGAGAGLSIQVQNQRTGTSATAKTSEAGEFLIDWANTQEPVRTGDVFLVKVQGCSASGCSKQVTYNGEVSLYVKLSTDGCPKCECDAQDMTKIGFGLALSALAAMIVYMGGGIKVYKNKVGAAVIQHQHKGIVSYHDANTKHSNPAYAHRLWKNDPAGCVEDVKKINEKGGLI